MFLANWHYVKSVFSQKGFPKVSTRPLNQREYLSFIRTKLKDCSRQITSGQYVYAMQATKMGKSG